MGVAQFNPGRSAADPAPEPAVDGAAALSPWPATETARVAAVARLKAAIGEDDDNTTARLGSSAAALVEHFAPGAPQPIRTEAVIRAAGWLRDAPASGARSESEGDIRTGYTPSATGALRASGAMGLLSPWKIRRAGVVA